jgi:hypothetical protein
LFFETTIPHLIGRKIIVLNARPCSLYYRNVNNEQEKEIIMSEEKSKEYMLIFRDTDWHKGLSPEEMQQVVGQWMTWFSRLKDEGRVTAGSPLEPEGKIVSGKGGRLVVDGPFAESKEAIGGYFLLKVESLDEAVDIARECPGLPYGVKVEVRPVGEACASAAEMIDQLDMAHSAA